jgi:hypothetical protein
MRVVWNKLVLGRAAHNFEMQMRKSTREYAGSAKPAYLFASRNNIATTFVTIAEMDIPRGDAQALFVETMVDDQRVAIGRVKV